MKRALSALLIGSCALAVGCAAGCNGAPSADVFCELGAEHEVARTAAKDVDAIDLVPGPAGALAFYSVAGGLFAQALDKEGARAGAGVRLGVRCDGGLDALADDGGIHVACLLHPRRGKHDEPGGVLLHHVGFDLRVERTQWFAGAGGQSEGVALARGARGVELAWHDGSSEAHRVMWVEPASPAASPRAISQPGRMAQAPNMQRSGARALLTWAENWIEGGELASRLVSWDGSGAPRTLLERAHVAAMPQLFALGSALGLAYRDRTREGAKTGLYVAQLDAHARKLGSAARVGRADGVGRPALEPCMAGVVAATPRTYGGDYFVGVNFLDQRLERTRGEQQFYEDSHAFTQVAAACLGTHALLLIAEFPQLQRDTAALRAVSYHCR